jgi:hypothetical protein
VQFWLPIPVGGVAHASLRLSSGRWAAPESDRHDEEEKEASDDRTSDGHE